jgi:hypothetical protein
MRRTLVVLSLLPLLVLACDRNVIPTSADPLGGSAAVKSEFGLSVSPPEIEIERGATGSVAITIGRTTNFKKPVVLTMTGVPDGVSATLTPQVTEGDEAGVTFAVSPTAPLGTSTVTITGKANGRDPISVAIELTLTRPLVPITLDFCASDGPLWFAYQNDGEAWTPVTPDANATVFFKATDKVAIAFTRVRRGSTGFQLENAYATSVLYVTAEELKPLSGVTCTNEFGSKAISGNFTGLGPSENGVLSMHLIPFTVSGSAPAFNATRKPDQGRLDLIATRRFGGEPLSFIIRRGLDVPNGGSVAPLSFPSTEAVAAEFPAYSVTGLRGLDDRLSVDFWTGATPGGLPSYQRLVARFGSAVTGGGTYRAAPASLLAPGDRHELTIRTGFVEDYSGVTSVFRNAGPQNLAIGPSLSVPTFEQIPGSAPPRFRASFASQSEYGAAVRLIVNGGNVFTIDVTAAYAGGTPATWDLAIPDFNAVAGWISAWNFLPGNGVAMEATAWNTAAVDIPALWIETVIPPWARPFADGTVVQFAGRRQVVFAQP